MGVYIKDMEIPENCYECKFEAYNTCFVKDRAVESIDRAPWCPLAPVPPHGRLIDADALKLTHCKECTLYPDKCLEKTADGCDWHSIYHIEHCAPTIIEAEEVE